MRQKLLAGVALALALTAAASHPDAHEPDGRTALHYEWGPPARAGAPRALRVLLTAIVPLQRVQVHAAVPGGIGLRLRAIGGTVAEATGDARPWPSDGASVGDLRAGGTVVLEMDVAAPADGGGILSFSVEAIADGRPVREGLGVVVGTPGTEPAVRHGAAEFPARRVAGAR